MDDNLYGTWGSASWTYTTGTTSATTFVIPEYEVEVRDNGIWIKYGNTYTRYGEIPVVKSVPVVEEPEVEELEMAELPDIFDF